MSGKKKAKSKDSQLVIRINGEERDRFVSLCDQLDTSAARELRGFIREFVARHESSTATQSVDSSLTHQNK